jgi:hypothetical protein
MIREFVLTEWFDASWKDLRLSDEMLRELQTQLLRDPLTGSVMQGTGGFRKMRFAFEGRGKSGSIRVVYLDIPEFATLYLMLAYPKSEKDGLTPSERNELKQISDNIKQNLQRKFSRDKRRR